MSEQLPHGRVVLTANEAAAYAVVLARARAIACYPITPQTLIVERLADLHVIGAARAGVRTFTATSSQGLLYAHEQLHRASRERVPLVVVDVNRAVFAPWSIEPDLTDSMSQRDTGWVQLDCSSAQEVLDIPTQEAVDAFVPELHAPEEWLLDPARPRTFSALPEPRDYFAFQRNVAEALDDAKGVIASVAAEFTSRFGREKVAALEVTGNPRAEKALVAVGTIADTAQELLADDGDLLVVRVHAYRPFPAAELAAVLGHATTVVVVDRAAAFGSLGPLGADVMSLDLSHVRAATNVVCGLGGAEVTPSTLRWALGQARVERTAVWAPEGV